MKKKIVIILTGVVITMGIATGAVFAFMYSDVDETEQFNLDQIEELQVESISAKVTVILTNTDEGATFHYYGKSLQELSLTSELSGTTLKVSPRRKYPFLGTCERTQLDIYLPKSWKQTISLETTSGTVNADSLELAGFSLSTTSGGLEVGELKAGTAVINTTSGRLFIKDITGNSLQLKGTSASMQIEKCTVSGTIINTTSGKVGIEESRGDIRVNGTSARVNLNCADFRNREIAVSTTSGSITLGLPEAAGFSIQAKTSSGKFQSEFDIETGTGFDSHNITGKTENPENKITLKTTSGRITLQKIPE